MQSMGGMVMIMTATGCVWSFLGAVGAREAGSVGSVELPGADMGPHPDAPSTGSLCRVSSYLANIQKSYYYTSISLGLLSEG